MAIWDQFVGFLIAVLFVLAQIYGSLGLAIIVLSFSVRLALLPITLRMARQAQEQQKKILALEPVIHNLKVRYRSDPRRFYSELAKLYRRHAVRPMDSRSLLSGFLQLPLMAGLFAAIKRGLGAGGRFLWISNLTRPDAILALVVGILTYLASVLSPSLAQQTRVLPALGLALLTVFFAWKMASGVGLYWATSASVGILQSALLRRSSK